MYARPYLDSSVYIAAIKGSPPEPPGREGIARKILEGAERGDYRIAASTFVAAEVVRDRGAPALPADKTGLVERYLEQPFIDWIELDLIAARHARRLALEHDLRPADAVHLSSAIRADCDVLLRWDDGFHEGVYEGVVVTDPYWSGQEELDFPSADTGTDVLTE